MAYRGYSLENGFIVSKDNIGDFTTITDALATATSGITIFIYPGTYTENITLKAGVNLIGLPISYDAPSVTISGTTTATYSGDVKCQGINFTPNGATAAIVFSGTSATDLVLDKSNISIVGATGITSTNPNANLYLIYSGVSGDGINILFNITSIGSINFKYSSISGGTCPIAAGLVNIFNCDLGNLGIQSTGTSQIQCVGSYINNSNFQFAEVGGSGVNFISLCEILTGSATAITIDAGKTLSLSNCNIQSSNTNAIAGSGTLNYSDLTFSASSSTIENTLSISQFGNGSPFVVSNGGTGSSSFNTNGAVISGSSATAALSAVSLANQTLLAGNTSAAPTAKSISVNIQTFTSSGTYTPTSGMLYCEIKCIGGGGAGGGAVATTTGQSVGSGGGAGEYAVGVFSASTIGSSQTITVPAAATGTAGSTGNTGGTVSVGTLITALGGIGGVATAESSNATSVGGLGGNGGTGGSYRIPGYQGNNGVVYTAATIYPGGGANSELGAGGITAFGTVVNGSAALGYGAGGGGAGNAGNPSPAKTGGSGAAGIVIITEYILS